MAASTHCAIYCVKWIWIWIFLMRPQIWPSALSHYANANALSHCGYVNLIAENRSLIDSNDASRFCSVKKIFANHWRNDSNAVFWFVTGIFWILYRYLDSVNSIDYDYFRCCFRYANDLYVTLVYVNCRNEMELFVVVFIVFKVMFMV